MNTRFWSTWALVTVVALCGVRPLAADDRLQIVFPESTEDGPPAPSSLAPVAPPRPFQPTGVVQELEEAASQRIEKRESSLDTPRSSFSSGEYDRLPTRTPREPSRFSTSRSTIRTTGGFFGDGNEQVVGAEGPEGSDSKQSVSLEWIGPPQMRVGQPFIYELVVHNHSAAPALDVVVRDRFPTSMHVVSVEPQGASENGGFMWNLGTIEPKGERRIKIEMVPTERGEMTRQATVTSTTASESAFRVTQPQLAIEAKAPSKTMIGDPVTFSIDVSNPGDGPAEEVVVHIALPEGLHHDKGDEFDVNVGVIQAGERRSIQLICATKTGGVQTLYASASGTGDLHAEAECRTEVTQAVLELVCDGPSLRYLDRQAVYTLRLTNTGDAAAQGVKATAALPAGFKFIACSAGGRHDFTAASVSWVVGEVGPGETKELSYECLAVEAGDQMHAATVTASRGHNVETTRKTRVEGISALLLEVVDIDDPIEVGAETAYEIRVTNQGSRAATNVEIHALVPPQMTIRGAQGPVKYRVEGQEILFAPLGKLAPRADAIFRVHVAGSGKGDLRFRARLISDSLTEPVIEEESTKVYED